MSKEDEITENNPNIDLQAGLTHRQKGNFIHVRTGDNVCLIHGTFMNTPVSIICAVYADEENGRKLLAPMYIEFTDEVLKHVSGPGGGPDKVYQKEDLHEFAERIHDGKIKPVTEFIDEEVEPTAPRRKLDS